MDLPWQTILSSIVLGILASAFASVVMGLFGGNKLPVEGKVRF